MLRLLRERIVSIEQLHPLRVYLWTVRLLGTTLIVLSVQFRMRRRQFVHHRHVQLDESPVCVHVPRLGMCMGWTVRGRRVLYGKLYLLSCRASSEQYVHPDG